ncbi:hypothetical protein KGQ19_48535, partial [Catenulispora sp. NL8]
MSENSLHRRELGGASLEETAVGIPDGAEIVSDGAELVTEDSGDPVGMGDSVGGALSESRGMESVGAMLGADVGAVVGGATS